MVRTIRSKIIWAFALLILLNLAAGFLSVYNFSALGTTLATILRENYLSVLAAENMVKSLEGQDNALLIASQGEEATVSGSFEENKKQFNEWYAQAFRLTMDEMMLAIRDSMQAVRSSYVAVTDSMRGMILQGAFTLAKNYYYDNVRPVSEELRKFCFRLFEYNQNGMYNLASRMQTIVGGSIFASLIASIVALGLSVVVTLWLLRVVIKPAENLTERVKQMGAGKLDLKIDVLSNDEIGALSREFNKMTERLRRFEQMNIEKIIAEKKKSETIVESISDGIIVTDAERKILHINSFVAELFGYKDVDAIGKNAAEVLRDAKILSLTRGVNSEDHGATDDERVSLILIERGDKRYFLRPKVTNVFDAEGKLYSVVTILQDVTQFKELDRMKSDFIATLSHEFKTPLTSMNMSVDILNQELLGPLNARQKELINSTKEDTQRLTKLARELLQLSKLESGKQEFKNEELDVRALVENTVKPLTIQFHEKNVAITTNIPDDTPHLVADEQQLSWVITNLVTNALKYTESGGAVFVRVKERDNALQFDVEDTGEGIAEENLKKIFDKFVQVKSATVSTPGSVGLGLAIAKEIVETYGGRIWAESRIGKGSTFSFTIPLRRKDVEMKLQTAHALNSSIGS